MARALKQITKFARYLFYRMYTLDNKNWGASNMPHFTALYSISFLMLMNLLTVYMFLSIVFTRSIGLPSISNEVKLLLIILALSISFINHLLLVRNGKYHAIVAEFQNETALERKKGTFKVWGYIIGTFLIPALIAIICGILKRKYA